MKRLIAASLLLSIVLFSYAQAASEIKDPPQKNNSQVQQLLDATQDEVKLLKAELQLVRSYQDNLLSTVYWSLGTLVTIAGLLVGIGWFANFRIYERDKAALTKELRFMLDEETRRLDGLIQNYKDKDIPELIESKSKEKYSSLKSEFKRAIDEIQNQVWRINYELKKAEHQKWIDRKVYSNALRFGQGMLDVSIKMDNKYTVSDSLDLILNDLKLIIQSSGSHPDADDISQIIGLLGKVNNEHVILAGSIKELLSKIKS